MPSPSDPHDPTPSPESESSGAARLLDEIRERLERLEGNLSMRERRAARLERTLREADARLQAERAQDITHRESLEQGLPRQIQEAQQQLEAALHGRHELEKRLGAQLARERELLARIERLTQERDRNATHLEAARQETEAVRARQRELEAQIEDIEHRRGQWEKAVSAARPADACPPPIEADLPKWLSSLMQGSRRWRKFSAGRRMAIAVTGMVLPIACVLSAISTYQHYPRTYRIEAAIRAPSEKGRALAYLDDSLATGQNEIAIRHQADGPVLVATTISRDRKGGLARADAIIDQAIGQLTAHPSTQPAEREQLAGELRTIDSRLAALTSRPASNPADPVTLLAGWQKRLAERQAIDASVADLDVKLQQPAPDASSVRLTPDQLLKAINTDPRLQADTEMLAGREVMLADAIRKGMDAARPMFADLAQTAAAADKRLEEEAVDQQDQEAVQAVQVIRNTLTNCAKAAVALSKTWQDERQALDASALDVYAHYQAGEAAARGFIEATDTSLALLQKTLDAVGQGGDEPSKRNVLRSNLSRDVQPAIDARETLAAAVRQLTPAENVDLATLAQGVGGLRGGVQDRRARLEQELRDQALAELRSAYDRNMQELRGRRDELVRKAAGMEAEVIRSAADAIGLLGDSQAQTADMADLAQRVARRPQLVARLAELDRANGAFQTELVRSPAVAQDITSPGALAWWTVAGGLAPIMLLAAIATGFWIAGMGRAGHGSLDDYIKALRK